MDLRFFEIYRSGEYLGLILGGALTSLGLTVVAGIAGFVFAFLLALLRFMRVPVLERIAAGYIDFIRITSWGMDSRSVMIRVVGDETL